HRLQGQPVLQCPQGASKAFLIFSVSTYVSSQVNDGRAACKLTAQHRKSIKIVRSDEHQRHTWHICDRLQGVHVVDERRFAAVGQNMSRLIYYNETCSTVL